MKKFIKNNKIRCGLSVVIIVGGVMFFSVQNRMNTLYPAMNFNTQTCKSLQMGSMMVKEESIDKIIDGLGDQFVDHWFSDEDFYTQWVNKTAFTNIMKKECTL